MEFSLDAMGKRIALDAPALPSFLDGICNGRKPDDHDKDVDNEGKEITKDDSEGESASGAEARRKISPVQLREIVS